MNEMEFLQTLDKCKTVEMVYSTTDYDIFKALDYNRDVTERRVAKLTASFSEKRVRNPIVVNEKFEVIDGQGRLETCKNLHLPVEFVVAKGANIEDCRRMNLYNTNWKKEDYVNSYVEAGIESYINIKKVRTSTGLPYCTILRLSNKYRGELLAGYLESGKAIFSKQDATCVERIFEMALEIRKALDYTKKMNDVFIVSVKIVSETPKYNHYRMLEKCKITKENFGQYSNLEGMLKEFSRIYNQKIKNESNKIYFESWLKNRGKNIRTYETNTNYDNTKSVKTLK